MLRTRKHCFVPQKGMGLIPPNQDVDAVRQRGEPWEALSFLLNRLCPGIRLSGDRIGLMAGKAPCPPRCLVRSQLPLKSRRTNLFTPLFLQVCLNNFLPEIASSVLFQGRKSAYNSLRMPLQRNPQEEHVQQFLSAN